MIIKVRAAKSLGDHRLLLEFSDDAMGEHDFSQITREKGRCSNRCGTRLTFSASSLRGVLTWPNGSDWDSIALHDEMKQAGQLKPIGDAAE